MAGLVPFNNRLSLNQAGFEDFYNVLDDFFNDSLTPRRSLRSDTFKLDVHEKEKEYCIEAELPGIKKEEIGIELNDGKLTISVKREENMEEQNKNYLHKERRFTSMQRSIFLADVNADGIKAKLEEGVLSLSIPKQEKIDTTKRISIE